MNLLIFLPGFRIVNYVGLCLFFNFRKNIIGSLVVSSLVYAFFLTNFKYLFTSVQNYVIMKLLSCKVVIACCYLLETQ